jgi:hypothetical protein
MGFLRKLSFWKKSAPTAIEPFSEPVDDEAATAAQMAKNSPAASIKLARSPACKYEAKLSPNAKLDLQGSPVISLEECTAQALEQQSREGRMSSKMTPDDGLREVACTAAANDSACLLDAAAPAGDVSALACRAADMPEARVKHTVANLAFASPLRRSTGEKPDLVDCLNFDSSLQETYAGVEDAFSKSIAASLQSTKWDKRSQALKSIAAVLKGLDLEGMAAPGSTGVLGRGLVLRDRTRCWRLSCQLLNHVMRDKVIPVRLAALDLYMDTFANTFEGAQAPETRYAAAVLAEHLFDRLGDSNLRLHEAARKCVLFSAERHCMLGLGTVLSRLRHRLETAPKGGERTKVHFGVLDVVTVLLEHFPAHRGLDNAIDLDDELEDVTPAPGAVAGASEQGRTAADSWTLESVAPFIIAGMDDSLGTRVRNSAVALAATVYRTFGSQAAEALMRGLRPAKQTLLRQKFKEMDEEEHPDLHENDDDDDAEAGDVRPDLDDMMICGTGLRPQPEIQDVHTFCLPGSIGDEESLMDGILEETGMVFNGTGIFQEGGQNPFGRTGEFEEFMEDQFLLEQELMALGLDLEDLDEQQALLAELCAFDSALRQESFAVC